MTEEHLFNLLGMCADPITGKPLGRQPNRAHLSLSKRVAQRMAAIPATLTDPERAEQAARIEAEEHTKAGTFRTPVAGFDLTFSPSKSVSTAWALADRDTKEQIYACHRRAIEVVLTYAERELFHSRSGTNGVVQEEVEGVVAAAFTHWDSRDGDPRLHDHVVVANRAQSVSDGTWRTLDSRGLFKSLVALSELHQGVLSDLLTNALGWGWDGRTRRHSEQLRFEVTGVSEALMAEFSQRSVAIEDRKTELVGQFALGYGRQPTTVEVLELRRRATLETRPDKEHYSLAEMTESWRQRAERYIGVDQVSWVAVLAERNDLPLLHAGDLADGILEDAAGVAVHRVAERRATFSRANVLAEVHRQLHGVRFSSPENRIAVAERMADLALAQSLLISAPELHHTPERLRRADGTTRFRAKGHEVYTTTTLLEAEAESIVGQLDQVERVHALSEVRRLVVRRQLVGPAHVEADALQPGQPLVAQLVEEGLQDAVVLALADTDDGTLAVVIGHHGQVAVPFAIGDLVDPDPVEVVRRGVVDSLGHHVDDDLGHRLPRDPQQLGDRRLVHPLSQPGDDVLEVTGVAAGRAQGTSSVRTR